MWRICFGSGYNRCDVKLNRFPHYSTAYQRGFHENSIEFYFEKIIVGLRRPHFDRSEPKKLCRLLNKALLKQGFSCMLV